MNVFKNNCMKAYIQMPFSKILHHSKWLLQTVLQMNSDKGWLFLTSLLVGHYHPVNQLGSWLICKELLKVPHFKCGTYQLLLPHSKAAYWHPHPHGRERWASSKSQSLFIVQPFFVFRAAGICAARDSSEGFMCSKMRFSVCFHVYLKSYYSCCGHWREILSDLLHCLCRCYSMRSRKPFFF